MSLAGGRLPAALASALVVGRGRAGCLASGVRPATGSLVSYAAVVNTLSDTQQCSVDFSDRLAELELWIPRDRPLRPALAGNLVVYKCQMNASLLCPRLRKLLRSARALAHWLRAWAWLATVMTAS